MRIAVLANSKQILFATVMFYELNGNRPVQTIAHVYLVFSLAVSGSQPASLESEESKANEWDKSRGNEGFCFYGFGGPCARRKSDTPLPLLGNDATVNPLDDHS